MPRFITDFRWHQTPQKVFLEIPIKAKPDIFLTPLYLKINARPQIFEAFFPETVDVEASLLQHQDHQIRLELVKTKETPWTVLSEKLDQSESEKRRQSALQWQHSQAEEQGRKSLESERLRERRSVEASLEAYDDNRQKIQRDRAKAKADFFRDDPVPMPAKSDQNTQLAASVAAENERLSRLAPIRNAGVIEFDVSERQFPAPKRESQREMEEQWKKRQKEALSRLAKPGEAKLEPEELLKKAEAFFQAGDYPSALEAYNYGILHLCPDYAPIWNNRSVVHLKMGQYAEVIRDCSQALQLMDPPVESNAIMRAKAFIRRGKLKPVISYANKPVISIGYK